MSEGARAKAATIVALLERADYPDIAQGVIAEALDAYAADKDREIAALRAFLVKVAQADDGSGCAGQCDFMEEAIALLAPPTVQAGPYERHPTAGPCACGLKAIPAGVDGVHWYWQMHRRTGCTVDLPNLKCSCGLLRSEHREGHADDASGGRPDVIMQWLREVVCDPTKDSSGPWTVTDAHLWELDRRITALMVPTVQASGEGR